MPRSEIEPPADDGLIIPEVGEHSRDKHYFLERYIDAFTTAMKKKPWSALNYIDLFAGAGIERLKESKGLEWGSALIAAQSEPNFDNVVLIEKNPEKAKALTSRTNKISNAQNAHVLQGDSNALINDAVRLLPDRSLTLAFLDPYGLHLDFETVVALAKKRCDLIIYFPDRVDMLRNWKINYRENENSNLDRTFGPDAPWRSIFEDLAQPKWVAALFELYKAQLEKVGFKYFEVERIYSKQRPIYRLIFASAHPLGAKIWRGVSKNKRDGQIMMDFGNPDE